MRAIAATLALSLLALPAAAQDTAAPAAAPAAPAAPATTEPALPLAGADQDWRPCVFASKRRTLFSVRSNA